MPGCYRKAAKKRTGQLPRVILTLLLLPVIFSVARAQEITFPQAVQMAWQSDPDHNELNTNYHSATARAHAAGSWFSGGPTISGQYFDDHAIGSNEGYTTYQGGISVPLWLPGQGTATVKTANAEALTVKERLKVARMAVAIKVLDSTAAVISAKRHLAIARTLQSSLEKLQLSVSRGVQAGEMTSSDQQAVIAEVANAQSECSLATEQVENATSALEIILGRPGVPDLLSYDEISVAHARALPLSLLEKMDPRVKTAEQNVRTANAGMRLARTSFMPNPEVGIGAIHEKQYGSPWDNRVGVTLSIPLPSTVRNIPIETEARNKVATAINQEEQIHRRVRQELTQVFSHLRSTENTFKNTLLASENMNKRANDMSRAWQAGEVSLIELLRAKTAAYSALQMRNQAEVSWHAAIIRAIIAAGEFE
ncbi:TolC family protein [Acetobacter thailandicus]|nr:TolC family protein [Acetobacter thailandicus]